jgi:prophage antirepressor-like protein
LSNLITISGVRGFIDENGTAQLNLEDCARGLGFTEIKDGKEYVMWRRVKGYLVSFGTTAEAEFIPENIFYRLAMKAKNETAEKFQALVADEILPAIRKTGTYSAKPACLEDVLIAQLQSMKEIRQQMDKHAEQLQTVNHRIDSLDTCNIAGDLQQRLGSMVKKYARDKGVAYNTAWDYFRTSYNTAFHTNLKVLITNYCNKHGLKSLTMPQYLSIAGKLEDAVRVADKMLNA